MDDLNEVWANVERLLTSVASKYLLLKDNSNSEDFMQAYYNEMDKLNSKQQELFNLQNSFETNEAHEFVRNRCISIYELSAMEPVKSAKPVIEPLLKSFKQKCTFNIVQKEGDVAAWEQLQKSIDDFMLDDVVAGGTIDLGFQQWSKEELQNFDDAVEDAKKTIIALKEKIRIAEKEGRSINKDDILWLKKIQIASPTGYRNYADYPAVIQMSIDSYESKFNAAHYRDALTLFTQGCLLKGTGHVNKVLFDVEIRRVTEFKEMLMLYKALGNRKK